MKKNIYIGILFLVICFSLMIYNELKDKGEYKTNIHEITNSGTKTEGLTVYLDASFIAGAIKHEDKNYYVIFGDGVQYLVLIDDTIAVEINKYLLDYPDNTYKIKGITKKTPSGIEENGIKFVNNYLNSTHGEDHEHNITRDDFYHYFGYVYLDTYTPNNLIIIILISITGCIGVLLILNSIIRKGKLL